MTGHGEALRLDGWQDAVPRARRLVRAALDGTEFRELADECELVVSELVTNALLHARPPVSVEVVTGERGVRVAVGDGDRAQPVRGFATGESMTGRGLSLVAALSARWGVDPSGDGKIVWAEVTGEGAVANDADPDTLLESWLDDEPFAEETHYPVSLGDVPTDLLLAAKAHVDNLVREFALAAAGAATGASAPVPAHLAELIENVTQRFAAARMAIKRQALGARAAGEPRTRLELKLPASAADAGEDYLAALDEADRYARAARLLTLETPPQHRAFRRWYVTSLVTQLRRAAAGLPRGEQQTFEQYLLDELGVVVHAQRVADAAARLQSVTASLAEATTVEQVAFVVVGEGVDALRASGGSLFVPVDDEHLAVPGAVGYADDLVARLQSERRDAELPAAYALRTGEAVWLESRQEREQRFPALAGLEPGTVAMCAVPLFASRRVLGALRFSFDRPRLFDDDERRFVLALAAQTALALERAWLLEAERLARARTEFVADALDLLTSSLDTEATARSLSALLVPRLADSSVVYVTDDSGTLLPVAAEGAVPPALLPPGVAEAAERAVTVRDVPVEGVMAVPLAARGTVVGAVQVTRPGTPYDAADQRLVEDVAARAAIAMLNAQQYERERAAALMLQRSLLPQQLPVVPGLEFAWRYLPAESGMHVGGDWYDVLPLDDGRVALAIGDVMGRGLQAAAVMGQLRATARAYASARLGPADTLGRLDEAVGRLEQAQITTAAFAVLDPSSRELTLASAGHLPPLVVAPDGEPQYLDVEPGPPLGATTERYAETTVRLPAGSLLLLFTDGLVEDRARGVDDGLAAARDAASNVHDVEALCDAVLRALHHDEGHDDDVAMLAVALRP